MDFNLDDLVSSACGAVADAADYLFGTDSDSSDYSESGDDNSDSSDSEYIGDNLSCQVTDGAAVTYDYSDGSDSSSDGSDYSQSGDDSSDSSDSEYIGDNLSYQVTDGAAVTYDLETTEAVLGATPLAANVGEDGKIADDDDYLEEKYKLVVGASIQVTDEAAATYDENGGPSESKSVWDCVLGVKDSISNGVSQGISNVEDEASEAYNKFSNDYQEAENAREQSNENEYNKIATDEEELENLQKQSDEMIQQRNAEEAFNNMGDDSEVTSHKPRDFLIQGSGGYSEATPDGNREEASIGPVVNITTPDLGIQITRSIVARGTPSNGFVVSAGAWTAEDGIPGLDGEGGNIGASKGWGGDYSYSPTSDGVTISKDVLSTAEAIPEVHSSITETKTYSVRKGLEEEAKGLNQFGNGYTQHMEDKITGADDQYADEQKVGDVLYDQVDKMCGGTDN